MRFELVETKEILDFEKEIGVELVMKERPVDTTQPFSQRKLNRYFVSFEHLEIKEGIMLTSDCGNGDTMDEALHDYCKKLKHKLVVLNAYDSENRKMLVTPNLVHTQLLGK